MSQREQSEPAVRPRVFLVDDHAVLAGALQLALQRENMEVQIATDLTPEGVIAAASEFKPELALLDLYLGGDLNAIPMVAPLAELGAKVLILTGGQNPAHLSACLEQGALAVLPKSDALTSAIEAVRAAMAGEPIFPDIREEILAAGRQARAAAAAEMAPFERLTPREREILAALVAGSGAEQIGASTYLTIATVRSHIRSILTKLGVNSQLAAVAAARQVDWKA